MLDPSAVPNVKGQSHLPIIVDPSHATGRPDLIPSMAKAAIAAGADGVHIEVHSCPEKALSDGPQALLPPAVCRVDGRLANASRNCHWGGLFELFAVRIVFRGHGRSRV
jgi:3-deoxy-D-arabino-heptulosonate 7-phosphate (DAHP) synthase